MIMQYNAKSKLQGFLTDNDNFDQNGSKMHSERSFWGGGGMPPDTLEIAVFIVVLISFPHPAPSPPVPHPNYTLSVVDICSLVDKI